VLLPILLISVASTFDAVQSLKNGNRTVYDAVQFLGNRNVALIIGAICGIGLLLKRMSLAEIFTKVAPPLETAGMIILITSAGGAFGLMLKNAGVGTAIQAVTEGKNINLIFLSWAVAGIIRVAQGSATVAMLTTAAMMSPMLVTESLPYHPVYVFCAIGFGAMMLSWMNDSGFWVVGRLSGFTEKETLKTWTVIATVNSVVGLIATWIASVVVPMAAR
jgi:GntP family gluconate:H+ symporter